jgi:hypothetical protein
MSAFDNGQIVQEALDTEGGQSIQLLSFFETQNGLSGFTNVPITFDNGAVQLGYYTIYPINLPQSLESSNPPATPADVVKAYVIHGYISNFPALPASDLAASPPIYIYTDALPLPEPYMSVWGHSFNTGADIGITFTITPKYWQFYKDPTAPDLETASFFIWALGF